MKPRLAVLCMILIAVATALACGKKSSAPPNSPPPTASCSLTPTSIAFGTVTTGSSSDRQVTLTNTGSITLSGTLSTGCPEFTIVGSATYSLAPAATRTFTVRFSPASSGEKSCTIPFGSPACSQLACTGTGAAPAPVCQVGPAVLNFENVGPYCTKTMTMSVWNSGTGTLNGTVSLSCPEFSVVGDPSYSLTAGQTKQVQIQFTPQSFGTKTCSISAGNGLCAPIQATGEGFIFLDTRGCVISPQTTTIDVGDVCVGRSATVNVPVAVGGGPSQGPIRLSASVNCPAPGSPGFSAWDASITPRDLPSNGGGATVPVLFVPNVVGEFNALIVLSCSDTGPGGTLYPRAYIMCSGRGVPACP